MNPQVWWQGDLVCPLTWLCFYIHTVWARNTNCNNMFWVTTFSAKYKRLQKIPEGLLKCYAVLIGKYLSAFKKIVVPLSSGSSSIRKLFLRFSFSFERPRKSTCLELCILWCMNVKWYSVKMILKRRWQRPRSQCPICLRHVWPWRGSKFGSWLKSNPCMYIYIYICVCVCVVYIRTFSCCVVLSWVRGSLMMCRNQMQEPVRNIQWFITSESTGERADRNAFLKSFVPPKNQYISTKLHTVTPQKTAIISKELS
jgi:hypothetical protein